MSILKFIQLISLNSIFTISNLQASLIFVISIRFVSLKDVFFTTALYVNNMSLNNKTMPDVNKVSRDHARSVDRWTQVVDLYVQSVVYHSEYRTIRIGLQ